MIIWSTYPNLSTLPNHWTLPGPPLKGGAGGEAFACVPTYRMCIPLPLREGRGGSLGPGRGFRLGECPPAGRGSYAPPPLGRGRGRGYWGGSFFVYSLECQELPSFIIADNYSHIAFSHKCSSSFAVSVLTPSACGQTPKFHVFGTAIVSNYPAINSNNP